MISELARFFCIVTLVIFTIFAGAFSVRLLMYSLLYFMSDNSPIPFRDILFVSVKIGFGGGGIAGVGIWLIYRFNLRHRK